jgi:hypothetical protein
MVKGKLLVAVVMGLLLVSCANKAVYKEIPVSISDSRVTVVEQYEAIAFNLKKIYDGIEYLCKDNNRKGCVEIRETYKKTRTAFITKGDALAEMLKNNTLVNRSNYDKAVAEFNILYNELKGRALELGIGGINK